MQQEDDLSIADDDSMADQADELSVGYLSSACCLKELATISKMLLSP